MSIFISYCTPDEEYAVALERALSANGFDTWFAPKDIDGGQNFLQRISSELSPHTATDYQGRIQEDIDHLNESTYYIMLLSRNAMASRWVRREFLTADMHNLPIRILKIDHCTLTPDFTTMLIDTQITDAYRLRGPVLRELIDKLRSELHAAAPAAPGKTMRLTYDQIGIYPIASGDRTFVEGDTLHVTQGGDVFFLAPPADLAGSAQARKYLSEHSFVQADRVFDTTLEAVCARIPVKGLFDMIQASRRKVFSQFLNRQNGCYFNNRKYGVSRISCFERTETMAETPVLRIETYLTDYFTHRVMKDVCKQLAVTHSAFIRGLDYTNIGPEKILFTSLGVNLLLSEKNEKLLLTSRSINAAETYEKHNYSLSVIEGVSISDYDTFNRSVSIQYAVFRGLKEELGVDDSYVRKDTLRFYDLFVNPANLEMGLSCSLELKPEYNLADHILPLHGKDEKLEIADKRIIELRKLPAFLSNNLDIMLPQALFTLCSFLETRGIFLLDRQHMQPVRSVASVICKDGRSPLCGDAYVWSEHYIAVIDGATPKGDMLWDGRKGDVFVSHLMADAISAMSPDLTAEAAIAHLNGVVREAYASHGVDYDRLQPEERLQCCVLIYSVERREVWSFGDCMLRINDRDFINRKEGDLLLAALRAFVIQIERDRPGGITDERELSQYGRRQILPYVKALTSLANRDVPFGYDVIDGGPILPERVKVYAVQEDDSVVMASDGYPRLFNSLEETERYLKEALDRDPLCVDILRGTKGLVPGNESYDDRTYVSFRVS